MLALQQTAGNRAVARLLEGGGSGASVSLHGRTHGEYDGGSSTVLGAKVSRARGCECDADDGPCLRATGTLKVSYHVDVVIEMPEVPGGLSRCQEDRVRTFLRTVLGPHEQEHARRLRSYNGTTTRPFSAVGCGKDAVTAAAQDKAQEMHDTEAAQRASDADAHSLAIDPFRRTIDLDC